MSSRFSIEGAIRLHDRMTHPIRRIESRLTRFVRSTRTMFRDLTAVAARLRMGFLAIGAAIAGASAAIGLGFKDIIDTGLEFDKTMASVAARFGALRGSETFNELQKAAQEAASTSAFTSMQAAQALAEMGAAGTRAADAIVALPTVMNLAQSAGIELGNAADILTDQMAAFGLETEDSTQLARNLSRVADVMAKGAGSTSQSFDQLTGALRNVSAGAASAGVDIETTTALLGALANQGEKGERAGTALNAMLENLRAPSRQANRELKRLGINLRDEEGRFRDVVSVIGDFERAFAPLTDAARDQAIAKIFGSQGRRAIQKLVASGTPGIESLREALRNSEGAAAEMAATMADSAAGDLVSFSSAMEALKLQVWSLVEGPFRQLIQATTEWVRENQDDILGALRSGVDWLLEHMPTIVKWATRIGKALAAVGVVLAALSVPMTVMNTVVIGTAAVVINAIVKGVRWAAGIVTDAWSWVKDTATASWDIIKGHIDAVVEFVVGLFVIVSRKAAEVLGPVWDRIVAAASWVRERWAPVGEFFGELWEGIASRISTIWEGLLAKAGEVFEMIKGIWAPIASFFSELWDGIVSTFQEKLGWVIDGIGGIVAGVRAVGREAMAGEEAEGAAGSPAQVVSPQERTARVISESTTTERAEVTIRDESGRAEVTRRPRGRTGIQLQPSGAM